MDKYFQFFKNHERLILFLVVTLGIGYLAHRYFTNSTELAKLKYDDAKASRDAQTEQNKILASKSAKDTADYAVLQTQLAIARAQRDAAIAQRDLALHAQQAKNDTLPLPDLGVRWAGLIGATPGADIKPLPDGLFVSPSASHVTVNMLEQVPVLQQNLKDKETEIQDGKKSLAGVNVLLTDSKNEVQGCKAELSKADTECKKQVDLVKAQNKKKNVFWTILGVVFGAVLGHKF